MVLSVTNEHVEACLDMETTVSTLETAYLADAVWREGERTRAASRRVGPPSVSRADSNNFLEKRE